MIVVGTLVSRIDGRILLACGFVIFGYSSLMLAHLNLGISIGSVVVPNFINGFAGGFVFVPLTTLTMGLLRKQEIGNAAGIYNLVRNIGGSIGISALTAYLARGSQIHQDYLGAHLTATGAAPGNAIAQLTTRFAMAGADGTTAHREALGALYGSLQQQAAVLTYADNFRLLGYLAFVCIPLVLLMAGARKVGASSAQHVGE